jgi:hypothetical protein
MILISKQPGGATMQQPSIRVTVTQTRNQCRHVHAAGNQCGSPALRHEQFCYFHHVTRRPKPPAGKFRYLDTHEPFELPVVEDRASALAVAAQILCRIASNDLDVSRAGRLLYNLQILISLMPREPRTAPDTSPAPMPMPMPVEELVYDETYGFIAPIRQLVEENPNACLDAGDNSSTLPAPQSTTTLDLQAVAGPPAPSPSRATQQGRNRKCSEATEKLALKIGRDFSSGIKTAGRRPATALPKARRGARERATTEFAFLQRANSLT